MAWSEHLATMNAAVFPEVGDPAIWTPGPSTPVWVVLIEPEIILGLDRSSVIAQQRILEVQKAEVPRPSADDLVVIGTRQFEVTADPTLSDDGSVWRCEAREL